MDELQEKAKNILENTEEIDHFAKLNRLSFEAAKRLLQELSEMPEVSKEVNNYIFSDTTPDELKAYLAGEEKGRKSGYAEGKANGIVIGVFGTLGTLTLAGLAYLIGQKRE